MQDSPYWVRVAYTAAAISNAAAVDAVAANDFEPWSAYIIADVACFVAIGATATTDSFRLPANTPVILAVPKGKVVSVLGTGNGVVSVADVKKAAW